MPKNICKLLQDLSKFFHQIHFEELEFRNALCEKFYPEFELLDNKELIKKSIVEGLKDIKFREAVYRKFCPQQNELNFKELEHKLKVELEEEYLNKNLAKSIMWLLITKFIKEEYVEKKGDLEEELAGMEFLKSLNTKNSIYIKKLEDKKVIQLLGYPTFADGIEVGEIEILGDNE